MGIYRVRMPQLGESVEEGTVVSWAQKTGAEVSPGDPLLEISTDKVDSEIESTVRGVLRRLLVEEGDTVPVGAVLAEIEVEGLEDTAEPQAPAPPADDVPVEVPPAAPPPRASSAKTTDSGSLLLSPVVRRLVEEHSIDLDDLAAFVEQPKVSRKVVEEYLAQRGDTGQAVSDGESEVIAFSRIRKLTAQRMTASKAISPHVATAIEVDFETIARLRAERAERGSTAADQRLTWLPFVACAVARTLGNFARLNASVRDGETLVVHRVVNLGIAVDLDGDGLVVPVVHDADSLDLLTMAGRIRDLAQRARRKSLTSDEISGGTFTITGQGPHGTLFTVPIINQPQVAILSVDGIRKRPVVVDTGGSEEIVAHHTGVLTLSWDHRAIDGVYAAGFLAALRDAIEGSSWNAELA